MRETHQATLLIGDEKATYSMVACLLMSENQVFLKSKNEEQACSVIREHINHVRSELNMNLKREDLEIIEDFDSLPELEYVIVINKEDKKEKERILKDLESFVSPEVPILINSESIGLSSLQKVCEYPERIIGANWTDPVHTTLFLELLDNGLSDKKIIRSVYNFAKDNLNKDPYLVKDNIGVRSRILSALAREAFYLVENGYATLEDIDRSFRNDAGYYLPFSGAFRYMDLMGPYAYGKVMKDLNRELSTEREVPSSIWDKLEKEYSSFNRKNSKNGLDTGEAKDFEKRFRTFSYKIKEIIEKYSYPFHYNHSQKHEQAK